MKEERITLYSPNGKHNVNTLNCRVKYDKDGNIIYPDDWQVLSEEQVQGLANKTLAWENGVLVEYAKTADEILAEVKQSQREKARNELFELQKWFTTIYDEQVKQAERCKRLGIDYDNKYGTLAELDTLAVEKSARIRELRIIISQ